jgi:hypothetical protein
VHVDSDKVRCLKCTTVISFRHTSAINSYYEHLVGHAEEPHAVAVWWFIDAPLLSTHFLPPLPASARSQADDDRSSMLRSQPKQLAKKAFYHTANTAHHPTKLQQSQFTSGTQVARTTTS